MISAAERAYRARLRAQVKAQQELDESRIRIARWEAMGAATASIAQASVGNPMWSSAAVALIGAGLATVGLAIDKLDPKGQLGNVQKPTKTVGYGMMAFAGAKEAGTIVAEDISKIAAAFRGGSNAQAMSLAFDVPNSERGSAGGASVQIGGGAPPLPTGQVYDPGGAAAAAAPATRRHQTVINYDARTGSLTEDSGGGKTIPLLP